MKASFHFQEPRTKAMIDAVIDSVIETIIEALVQERKCMAQICPQLDDVTPLHGGLQRERDVIERLQLGLPDAYCVVHSAGWHSVRDGHDHYGEIDVVVIAPTGSVL